MHQSILSAEMDAPIYDALYLTVPHIPRRKLSLFSPEPSGDLWDCWAITAFFFLLRFFGIFTCNQACIPQRRHFISTPRIWQMVLLLLTIGGTVLDTWKSIVRYKNRISLLEFTALAMMITRIFFGMKNIISVIKMCTISEQVKSLLVLISNVCTERNHKTEIRKKLNRLCTLCIVIGISSVAATWLAAYWSFSLIVAKMSKENPNCHNNWYCDAPNPLLGRVPIWVTFLMYFVIFTVYIGVDVFSQLLLILFMYPLGLQFGNMTNFIKDTVLLKKPWCLSNEQLRNITLMHLELSGAVRKLNKNFSLLLLLMYLADLMGFITTTSLGLHRDSTKGYIDMELLPLFIGLVLISAAHAVLRTAFAVWLNEKAHSVLPYLHVAILRIRSEEDKFLCVTFITRLQGARVALTAGGFFYVTREFVITMFGILLTYVLFMYQMEDHKYDVTRPLNEEG